MFNWLIKWAIYFLIWDFIAIKLLDYELLGAIAFVVILIIWIYLCYFDTGCSSQEEYDEATRHPTPEEIDAYCRERGITDEYGNYR